MTTVFDYTICGISLLICILLALPYLNSKNFQHNQLLNSFLYTSQELIKEIY